MKHPTFSQDHITEKGKHEFGLIQQLFEHKKQRRKTIKHLLKTVEQDAVPDHDLVAAVNNFIGTGPLHLYRKGLMHLMIAWLDQATDLEEIREMKHNYQYLYELMQSLEQYQTQAKYTTTTPGPDPEPRSSGMQPDKVLYYLEEATSLVAAAMDSHSTNDINPTLYGYLQSALMYFDE